MLVLAVSIAVEVAWPSTGVEVDNAVLRMVLSGMLAVLSVTLLFADVVNAGVDDVAKPDAGVGGGVSVMELSTGIHGLVGVLAEISSDVVNATVDDVARSDAVDEEVSVMTPSGGILGVLAGVPVDWMSVPTGKPVWEVTGEDGEDVEIGSVDVDGRGVEDVEIASVDVEACGKGVEGVVADDGVTTRNCCTTAVAVCTSRL